MDSHEESQKYDVFFSYNTQDIKQVKDIYDELTEYGVRPYLALCEIRPGRKWVPELSKQIRNIQAAAFFFGENGMGSWQSSEYQRYLDVHKEDDASVIPVTLEGFDDTQEMPDFLKAYNWVDFRVKDPDPIGQLLWGIDPAKRPQKEQPEYRIADFSEAMIVPSLEKMVEEMEQPGALPRTALRVLALISEKGNEDKVHYDDIEKIIGQDAVLTAKILGLVNSALYAPAGEVTSLKTAISYLTIGGVMALALADGIYSMTKTWEVELTADEFWRHSLQVGITARLIAKKIKYKRVEEAFVCGLLHDIGLLLEKKTQSEEFDPVWKMLEEGYGVGDESMFDYRNLHAYIGRIFLESIHVPALICRAVGEHHNVCITDYPGEEYQLSNILALANLISPFSINRKNLEPDVREEGFLAALMSYLNLNDSDLHEIKKEMMIEMLAESELFKIGVRPDADFLREASRIIREQYEQAIHALEKQARKPVDPNQKMEYIHLFRNAQRAIADHYNALEAELRTDWYLELINRKQPEGGASSVVVRIIREQYDVLDRVVGTVKADLDNLSSSESA